MGLLDDYGIDLDGVEAPNYDIADDIYEFVVGNVYIQAGTDKHPDKSWICIEFLLGESGKSKIEWFQLPADASDHTDDELTKLGYYKQRLLSLGVDEADVNSVGADDLVGITGTLQVFTKGGWQNIKNVKVEEAEEEEAPVAAAPKTVRKPAAKPAAAAEEETEDEAPAAPAVKRAGVKPNPFA